LALSHSIVELEGLVNIPIVRQINLEEYELISGYLEYFAYAQASKMSSKIPDRISVFIADKKSLAAVTQQLEILQAIEYIEPSSVLPNPKSDNVNLTMFSRVCESGILKPRWQD
jgi:nucleoid-associated protein YejK